MVNIAISLIYVKLNVTAPSWILGKANLPRDGSLVVQISAKLPHPPGHLYNPEQSHPRIVPPSNQREGWGFYQN